MLEEKSRERGGRCDGRRLGVRKSASGKGGCSACGGNRWIDVRGENRCGHGAETEPGTSAGGDCQVAERGIGVVADSIRVFIFQTLAFILEYITDSSFRGLIPHRLKQGRDGEILGYSPCNTRSEQGVLEHTQYAAIENKNDCGADMCPIFNPSVYNEVDGQVDDHISQTPMPPLSIIQNYNISNMAKLEFPALEVNGKN
ncbi:hypothetical protein LXL04_030186 [Taraxacum kok-saghyz]